MPTLPEPLERLILSGTLDVESAKQVEQFRQRTGMGLADSLAAMGIAVSSVALFDKPNAPTASPLSLSQMTIDPGLNFDAFLRCPQNELALSISRSLAVEARPLFPLCLVHAPMGMGKTHLLSAVALATQNRSLLFFHTSDLGLEFQNAYSRGEERAFRAACYEPDILLLDDLDWCRHTQSFQEELSMVFQHRLARRKCTFISLSMPPERTPGLDDNLTSLLEGAVTCTLSMGDFEFRLQLLRKLVHGQALSPEVQEYLASAVSDNFRKLKGAAAQLYVMSEFTRIPITVEVARAVVPMPEDLAMDPRLKAETDLLERRRQKAGHLREMLREAETQEEQCLALQITISESIQLLRTESPQHPQLTLLENALVLVQNNEFESALKTCAGFFTPHNPASKDAIKKE
jgi:chromosomal replication initiation ATPase DnaA